MGARLINNPRRTKIGHVEAFPVLHMRSLRKSAMFSEGQRTEGHFLYPGASNAITIIVDLRSEHDLKVLLEVGHTDSATNMQVIGLTHRPTGLHGRRWFFVSANGEKAETLFLVEGFFRTRTEAAFESAARRKTLICCLSTQISASSVARARIRSTSVQKIRLQRSVITR